MFLGEKRLPSLMDQSGDIAGCCLLQMQYRDDGTGYECEVSKIKEMKNAFLA